MYKDFRKRFHAGPSGKFLLMIMITGCLFAGLAGCGARENGNTDVTENIQVEFKDASLEEAIRQLSGIPEGMLMTEDVLSVKHFNAPRLNIQIDSLEGVQHLENLKTLEVPNTQIPDDCLAYIKDLENLRWLDLWNTNITDAGLKHVGNITSLTQLFIGKNDITDSGLVYLRGLSNLRVLNLTETGVTEEGIAELKNSLPAGISLHY